MTGNQSGRAAVKIGAICGLALGCLTGIQFTLALIGVNASALQDMGGALMLASLVAYFVAGVLVRRYGGWVETAAAAGLLAGLTAGLISCAAAVALDGLAPNVYAVATPQAAQTASGLGAATLAGMLNLAVQAGLGAGLAVAGALARRPKTAL
jgi:hypothetical protein